jgi:hypothetical protein
MKRPFTGDSSAYLSRVLPTGWQTWTVPSFTKRSMQYGAVASVSLSEEGEEDTQSPYNQLLEELENDTGDGMAFLNRHNSWLSAILTAITF